jgi:hypothetical protein
MSLYKNEKWKFEINLPKGWAGSGFLRRLFRPFDPANPELYGSRGVSLKFAIGPISPEPSLKQMQKNIENISRKYGHLVVETGSIPILGKEHATILYHVPISVDRSVRLKNYHLIFNGIEFVITGKVALFTGIQGMSGPRPGMYSSAAFAAALIPIYPELLQLYACDDDYDDIIKTFKLILE